MAEEESIKRQIAALEGWAIKVKQNTDSGNYKEAEELLRTINTQARRLEWRGGKYGLKHLPKMEEVKTLKERISQARAAAKQAMTSIKYLERIKKEGKTPAEVKAIEKKASGYKKDASKNITSLIQVLKLARGIADKEPWASELLATPENKELLWELLRKRKDLSTVEEKNLAKIDFRGRDFKGANLYGARFWDANLMGANFEKVDLRVAHFEKADLRGANFKGANLYGANLDGANLKGAKLDGANLEAAWLKEANLEKASLKGANISRAKLENANLRHANLEGANLALANLKGADILNANLKGASLVRADLTWANLVRANLEGADLDGANLLFSTLSSANLKGAILKYAEIIGTSFNKANLEGVDFEGAKFDSQPHGLRTMYVVFKEANLKNVKNLTKNQIEFAGIRGWKTAKNVPELR